MEENELKILKYYVSKIIEDGGSEDPKQDMLKVADYYQYLSSSINPDRFYIDANKELILSFESLYLWLNEKTASLSSSIKKQIEDIFISKNLCEIFAILSSVPPEDIWRINRANRLGILGSLFAPKLNVRINDTQAELISSRNLLDTKVALTRLSQVVRFSASKIDDSFINTSGFEDFKKSYDPDLINKTKVSALIGILQSQLSDLPEDENTKLILEKLDEIEKEVKKSKPHWGVVFSTLFVIFGFAADLKTLNPELYEKPVQTIEKILYTVHQEGKVETNRSSIRLISSNPEEPPTPGRTEKFVFQSREEEFTAET